MKGLGRAGLTALLAAAGALALTACDGGPATKAAREQAPAGLSRGTPIGYSRGGGVNGPGAYRSDPSDPRNQPIPLVAGKPMWAANRQHTAAENAEYHFERDGADFGARTVEAYVAKAHAFVDKPPPGVRSLTRSNGDRLIYDPKANIFAVVTREGAPRTLFKPRDGAAYWQQQQQREAEGGDRSYRADRGGGSTRYARRPTHASEDDAG